MKKILLSITLIAVSASLAIAGNDNKKALAKEIETQCISNYKQANNPDITEDIYTDFCTCMASEYESKMTEQELTSVKDPRNVDKELKMKMAELMQPCADEFSRKITEKYNKK